MIGICTMLSCTSKCIMWCNRYVWIDLSAGPVEMATLKDNSNSINQWTLPRLEHYGTPSDFRSDICCLYVCVCVCVLDAVDMSYLLMPLLSIKRCGVHLFSCFSCQSSS